MKSSTELVTKGQQPAHRRIFEGLRSQILTGKFIPGTQLPGARDLATVWQTSSFTMHTALRSLAKEGWINRRPHAGTYIANPRDRFLSAGIYQTSDPGHDTSTSFARNLHFSLLNQLDRLGKKTQVFIDSRPEKKQGKILPALAEALEQRRIQCVIAPSAHQVVERHLARLPVPTAFLSNRFSPNRVVYDNEGLFRESVRRLAAEGCRSVGMISPVAMTKDENGNLTGLCCAFRQAAKETGLMTREEWLGCPPEFDPDLELFGYRAFKKLWSLRKKPDGLVVFPDTTARGVITAALEVGIRVVPRKMKFVFHRNVHVRVLCPFPVTWAVSDEDEGARELISLIQKQFKGEEISPLIIPYKFRVSGPALQ